tara:strand:- start:339 stop:593 length:255 start_codon:yes stop_codon:yes gene_type:complete
MYRSILRRSRFKQKIFQKMQKTIHKSPSDKSKTNTCKEKTQTCIQKSKPVNFNKCEHLNEEFRFSLEKENRRSRNINDLDIFLL